MNKKILTAFCAFVLSALCCGVQAQEREGNPNPWFIQGQLGASYATGNTGIGKLISPAGQIAAGKYFSPVWGARLAVSGWQGRAGSGSRPASSFYYGAATVDGLMNISQLIKKYPERPVDVSLLVGVGFNRAFEQNVSSFVARAGLQMGVRLNEAFDFNVEATVSGVSDRWNGLDDHSFDTYTNLTVGLTYKFKTGYRCVTCVTEEYPEVLYTEEELNARVNEQRAEAVAEVKEVPVRQTDTVFIEKEAPADKVVKGIRSHVAFGLGKTNIEASQEMNILAVADYLKKYPEANATISGYADTGTGTPEINLRLARQRAEAVKQCMTQKYGISADRLTVTSMEGDEQPFSTNDWNRVVIIIAD